MRSFVCEARCFSSVAGLFVALALGSATAMASPKPFSIDVQEAPRSLLEFGRQSALQILFASEKVKGIVTNAVHGNYEPIDALKLLLKGTPLVVSEKPEGVLVVEPMNAHNTSNTSRASASDADSSTRVAQATTTGAESRSSSDSPQNTKIPNSASSNSFGPDKSGLTEIVVTGTHIRGAAQSASPVKTYTREDIDRMGVDSVEAFIQKLPQNFNGGASQGTIDEVTGGGGTGNAVGGTGVNLRGLGNSSTLVLMDGHRLAPGNYTGNFVDVSLIPLNAVERVEIVTDGASAIYGSDAVGGVVNFILRKDFEGAETQARYGSLSASSSHEIQVGQTAGLRWDGGSALVSYDFYDHTPLSARDRPYTQSAPQPFNLVGEQTRHGALLSVSQDLGANLNLFAEGTYAKRAYDFSVSDQSITGGSQHTPSDVDSYSATTGLRGKLAEHHYLDVSATYAGSNTHQEVVNLSSNAALADRRAKTGVLSIDMNVDGPLSTLPTGDLRFALGAQYRNETLNFMDAVGTRQYDNSRSVSAGFLELRVPLLSPRSVAGTSSPLELTVADRFERYSDFGTTINPKIGLAWEPSTTLRFRGTYGTSFKAPLLNDLNSVPRAILAVPLPDPSAAQRTTKSIIIFGGNPDLKPEKAKTWTIGADLNSRAVTGFKADASYYNIRYRNRIQDPSVFLNAGAALAQEAVLGPSIVQRDPSAALVAQLYAAPNFANFAGPPSSIGAVLDYRTHNLSTVKTSGVDLDLSYRFGADRRTFETGIDATYILKFDTQFTSAAPIKALLNTPYNPVNFRLRARETADINKFLLALYVNYVNAYNDNQAAPTLHVSSWTTADLTVGYQVPDTVGFLRNVSLQFSALNITNAAPPYVRNLSFAAIAFDGANANALGRALSIQLSKRW